MELTGLADVDIRLNEWAAMLRSLVEWGTAKDPATVRNAFGLWTAARIADAYAYLWYMYHSNAQGGQGRNLGYYHNPGVDALIDRAALATDDAEKLAIYQEAHALLVAEAIDLPVGVQSSIYAVRADLGGFQIHPGWYPAVRLYTLHR